MQIYRVFLTTHEHYIELACDHYKLSGGTAFFFGDLEETLVSAYFVRDHIVGIVGHNLLTKKKTELPVVPQDEEATQPQLLTEVKI